MTTAVENGPYYISSEEIFLNKNRTAQDHNRMSSHKYYIIDEELEEIYKKQRIQNSNKGRTLDPHALKQQIYLRHNNYRSHHNSPLLCWSAELAEFAQNWAENISEKGYLQYSEHPALGENIIIVDTGDRCPSGEEIVDEWYRERRLYNYCKPGWSKDTYHFSQIVWRNSSEIGVGVQKLKNQNRAVIVVNYKPPGNNNFPGDYEKNVLLPRSIYNKNGKKRNSCQNSF